MRTKMKRGGFDLQIENKCSNEPRKEIKLNTIFKTHINIIIQFYINIFCIN